MNEILAIIRAIDRPVTASTVAKRLRSNQVGLVKKTLDKMVREGKLVQKDGKYSLPEGQGLIEGIICATYSGTFFLKWDGGEDLKVLEKSDVAVMNNDRVLARKKGGHCFIVKIVEHGNSFTVGNVIRENGTLFLMPDDKKINEPFIIPKGKLADAKEGDKAVGEIISYPTKRAFGTVRITQVLGSSDDDDAAIASALFKYGVRDSFPQEVLDEAEGFNITESDLDNRLDLRKLNVITIDGDDAKDLDDAVSLEITEKGEYLLGVHIADVSHYVRLDGAIDKEARTRGTSVYIPGKVFPMLPTQLSNGICSLNENVDRLTLSCFMVISRQGKLMEYSIQPSVIRNKHRMTYNEVTEMLLDSKSPKRKEYKDVFGMILLMRSLAELLISCADKRGYIDFDLPEAKITLDETGFPVEIKEYEVGISNKIIEQFMLIANETVAAHMRKCALPSIYRVHEPPEEKKLESFRDLTEAFGYKLPEAPKPADFQDILKKAEGKPEEALIKKTMLRSMSKAKYKMTNDGHFGLAYDNYLHFTSPIRRYPDLTVHHALNMSFTKNYGGLRALGEKLENIANNSTATEINAALCERDVDDIRKAQYMSRLIGEEFEGSVSGVTAYGMYVELGNTVEGFIPVGTMDGYYHYDEARFALTGHNGTYRLGDRVRVRVFGANIQEDKVEFTLLT